MHSDIKIPAEWLDPTHHLQITNNAFSCWDLPVYGLRRWNQDWMMIGIAWAQDRGAWAAAVRDAVVAIDAGATALR